MLGLSIEIEISISFRSIFGSFIAVLGIFLMALQEPYVFLTLPLYTTPKAPLPSS